MYATLKRWPALSFWAALIVLELILVVAANLVDQGALASPPWMTTEYPEWSALLTSPFQLLLLVGFGLEAFAFTQARRNRESAQTPWLSAASLLMILAVVMFAVPPLLLGIFDSQVTVCGWGECEAAQDHTDLGGPFLLMYLVGLVAVVGSLICWNAYRVRLKKLDLPSASVS